MEPVKIRQVKREIRVLGIAAVRGADSFQAVGVVFRGGLWIDGVIKTASRVADLTDGLVEMVKGSPHHPQIRVILLHDGLIPPGASIDPFRLATGCGKPAIYLSSEEGAAEPCPGAESFPWGDRMWALAVGLKRRDAERVLRVSTGLGPMPEALRVAGLVTASLTGFAQHNV